MKYAISFPHPLRQRLQISLRLDRVEEPELYFQLPAWRPGRYEMQHFAKNIFSLEAFGADGQPLPSEKVEKDRWRVLPQGQPAVELRYVYRAAQMDAGGSWLDDQQVYLNFINFALLPEGREEERIEVSLDLPRGYEVASALPGKGRRRHAPNFATLVDSPLIASPSLQHGAYEAGGCVFHLWIQGECQPDWERLLRDFRAFTETQIAAFGTFPCQQYHFLVQALPYRYYHGVEHQHSTVIALGPSERLMGDLYDELLGVCSHELYHTWNVTRLRPQELVPYRWHDYQYFRTGLVAEGITTYFGDLMLGRSGVWAEADCLRELNTLLQRHFANDARFMASLAASSFDLWLDGYSQAGPRRSVSIYVKGALAAFVLDARIGMASGGQYRLDDVMRLMWERHAEGGYSMEDYQQAVAHFLGEEGAAQYWADCVEGTADMWPLLQPCLAYFGFDGEEKWPEAAHEREAGCVLQRRDGAWRVSDTRPGSPAEELLCIGDELVAVNGRRAGSEPLDLLWKLASPVRLHVFRQGVLREAALAVGSARYGVQYAAKPAEGDEAARRRKAWLGLK
jgi:predicted metalloprotease with PDZ domain